MKKSITLTILMLATAVAACYSISEWQNYIVAIMFCFFFCVFWIALWYIHATEMPEDFDDDEYHKHFNK